MKQHVFPVDNYIKRMQQNLNSREKSYYTVIYESFFRNFQITLMMYIEYIDISCFKTC